jgi:hypothetical protein
MRKEQKFILNLNYSNFREEINDHLREGWKVVPGTLVMQGITINGIADWRYAVVLEK